MNLIKLSIISIFILYGNISFSQYQFGFRGGVGISDFVGSDFSKVSTPKLGMEVDMFYEREFNPTLSIAFELNYNQKGSKYEFFPKENTTVFIDIRSTYIHLPILLKAYFGHKANYYLYTGVSYGKLLGKSLSHYAKEGDFEIPSEAFVPYELSNNDASVIFGFGFVFQKIILDFRYQHGLTNIYQGLDAPAIRNHFACVSVGYVLYKKKVSKCMGSGR